MRKSKKDLLIIFTRNIVLGRCKTRLAKTIGNQKALEIYRFLVQHTVNISRDIDVDKWVFYSEHPEENDLFDNLQYKKFSQVGADLGIRMDNAFNAGFEWGYERIIIIGSDIYDLDSRDLEAAFSELKKHEYVLGPAQDGGYYLLGMKRRTSGIFENKPWGTDRVLEETLNDLQNEDVKLLDKRNDVDIYEDIADIPVFQRLLNN